MYRIGSSIYSDFIYAQALRKRSLKKNCWYNDVTIWTNTQLDSCVIIPYEEFQTVQNLKT